MKAQEYVAAGTSPSREHLEALIETLASQGIEHVFVMAHPAGENGEIQPIRGLESISQPPPKDVPRASAKGAAAGAVVGGAVAAGSMVIPFAWPMVLVTAPLAVLIGAGAGAAIEGSAQAQTPVGEVHALEDFNIPDPQIGVYREALKSGQFFVAVRSHEESIVGRALTIFEKAGLGHLALIEPGQPPDLES